MTAKIQTRRRLLAVAVLVSLAGAALSGCAAKPTGTDPANADSSSAISRTIGPETLLQLEKQQGAVATWAEGWAGADCTAERAASGDRSCAAQLTTGQLIAASTALLFGSLVDFNANTESTDRIANIAEKADERGREWIDGQCPGEAAAQCARPTTDLVDALLAMTEEVSRWKR